MPSGTSRLPSRIGFVNVSGVDSNRRRRRRARRATATADRPRPDAARCEIGSSRPDLGEHAERLFGRSGAQNLVVLLEQPRRRALRDLVAMRADGIEDRRIDREVQARGERDGAQHADRILAQPHFRIADRSHDAGAEIFEAADVVDDRERRDVVDERVDREVAPERVLFRRAEGVVVVDQVLAFGRASGSGAGTPSCTTSSPGCTCRRNVATSMTFGPNLTCASRKRRPMIQQLRKSFLT